MEQTLEALARFRAARPARWGCKQAPHRRHRRGARRQQRRGVPQADRGARAQAALAVRARRRPSCRGSGVISGIPRRARHRRRPRRRQPRTGRGRARRRRARACRFRSACCASAPSPTARRSARQRSATSSSGSRLADAARGHGLYLVGGSFRALALLDLKLLGHPLPIVHQHRIRRASGSPNCARCSRDRGRRRDQGAHRPVGDAHRRRCPPPRPCSSDGRGARPGADDRLGVRPARRAALPRPRRDDPRARIRLLAAALEVGERLGRFGDHGAALDQWIEPLFPDEAADWQRLRLAACLLADIALERASRFPRRARGRHGAPRQLGRDRRAWPGDARPRLVRAFGGDGGFSKQLAALLQPGEDERAIGVGQGDPAGPALQRRDRGAAAAERASRCATGSVVLTLQPRYRVLASGAVERRLAQLGQGARPRRR